MQLTQLNMFGKPEIIAAVDERGELKQVSEKVNGTMLPAWESWGKSIGGQWEQVQAALKAAEAAKAGAQ